MSGREGEGGKFRRVSSSKKASPFCRSQLPVKMFSADEKYKLACFKLVLRFHNIAHKPPDCFF